MLNDFLLPSYDYYDNGYSSWLQEKELQRRRTAEIEWCRRQREIQRRRQEAHEQQAMRRREELLRLREEEEEHRRRADKLFERERLRNCHASRLRREEDALKRAHLPPPQLRRQMLDEDDDLDERPEYQFFKGTDGRYYRVPISTNQEHRNALHGYPKKEMQPQYSIVRGSDGRLYRVLVPPLEAELDEEMVEQYVTSPKTSTEETLEKEHSAKEAKESKAATKKKKKQKKHSKKVTIIVEDASDSENDDDVLNSPWRNRRPSPGQWMEPVEAMAVE